MLYEVITHGLYAYDPSAGAVSLWDRELPSETGENLSEACSPGQTPGREGLGLGIDAGGTYTDAVIYDFNRGTSYNFV